MGWNPHCFDFRQCLRSSNPCQSRNLRAIFHRSLSSGKAFGIQTHVAHVDSMFGKNIKHYKTSDFSISACLSVSMCRSKAQPAKQVGPCGTVSCDIVWHGRNASFCHFEAGGFVDFCTLWHFGSYFCSSEVLIRCIFLQTSLGVHDGQWDSTRFWWGRGRNRRGSRGASRVELCWAMNMFQSIWNILNIINIIMIDIIDLLFFWYN